MGRGRAKAKQTKVARELKYQSFDTDFGALARELHGDSLQSDGDSSDDYQESHPEWADVAEDRD